MSRATLAPRRHPDPLPDYSVSARLLREAEQHIDASALADRLDAELRGRAGPTRQVTFRTLLIGAWINARLHPDLHLTKVLETLRALPASDRRRLNIERDGELLSYRQVHGMWAAMVQWFKDQEVSSGRGLNWYVAGNAIVASSARAGYKATGAAATDGTAVPTWGALNFNERRLDADPDVVALRDALEVPPATKPSAGPVALYTGADNRPVYTKDPDARAGHKTATNSAGSGGYCGYELHTQVQARSAIWRGDPTSISLGEDAPAICLGYDVAPAGGHRGASALRVWDQAAANGLPTQEQIVDRGYSQLKAEKFHLPARQRGLKVTMDLVKVQRERVDTYKGALALAGTLFHESLPIALRILAAASRVGHVFDPALEALYNERAAYRFAIHQRPDLEGVWRARCPFHSGFLKNKTLYPPSARRSRKSARTVATPAGMTCCCEGIMTVGADVMADTFQEIPYGTTAWRLAYGRRQVAESFNAALKTTHGAVGTKGSIRMFGLAKVGFMLSFAIVAANMALIQAFERRRAIRVPRVPTKRQRRRSVTTASSLGVAPPSRTPSPP